MANVAPPLPAVFLSEDLLKPVWSAAWMALVMTIFEGLPKSKRLAIFGVIVLAGSIYLIHKRQMEEEE